MFGLSKTQTTGGNETDTQEAEASANEDGAVHGHTKTHLQSSSLKTGSRPLPTQSSLVVFVPISVYDTPSEFASQKSGTASAVTAGGRTSYVMMLLSQPRNLGDSGAGFEACGFAVA